MTAPPRIRPAHEQDLPAIFEIYHEQVRFGIATFDTETKTPAQQREWWAKHDPVVHGRYPALVAEVEGRIAGWATLSPWSDRRAYDRTAEVSEYIHPDYRGRGMGKALLGALIEHARARGISVLIARVVEGNPQSLRLHEKLGFGTVGVMRRVGEKFGELRDVRIMDLHLDRPDATSAS